MENFHDREPVMTGAIVHGNRVPTFIKVRKNKLVLGIVDGVIDVLVAHRVSFDETGQGEIDSSLTFIDKGIEALQGASHALRHVFAHLLRRKALLETFLHGLAKRR